jgi:outer membrane protein OmpA-like peptidoglycan-associated protein
MSQIGRVLEPLVWFLRVGFSMRTKSLGSGVTIMAAFFALGACNTPTRDDFASLQREVASLQTRISAAEEKLAVVEPALPPLRSVTVYFDFDKAELDSEAEATVDGSASEFEAREMGRILIAGHTDTAGPAEYNELLSQLRANTVASELVGNGIPASVIETEALGETELAVETPDGVQKAANRRAVIDFVP